MTYWGCQMHDEGRRNSEYSYLPIPQLLTAMLCVTTISINCQIDLSSLAYPSLHFALQNSQSFLADCCCEYQCLSLAVTLLWTVEYDSNLSSINLDQVDSLIFQDQILKFWNFLIKLIEWRIIIIKYDSVKNCFVCFDRWVSISFVLFFL